jgi:hypothetical protein
VAVVSETLTARKRRELTAYAGSLEDELGSWLAATDCGTDLDKHHRQVRTIAGILRTLAAPINAAASAETVTLDDVARVEAQLLGLHMVWDFFRAKLSARCVTWLRPPLEAADELAWSCYEPALQRLAREDEREPPLVFPNADSSPFTIPRGGAFVLGPADDPALTAGELAEALQALPIPVIGIPWLQGRHLLGALVIGHEVGHDVEHALELGPVLDGLLREGIESPERRAAWLQWRAEVFADIYGTLVGGPSFTATLIDFLAGERRIVAGRRLSAPMFGAYPTRPLRVLLSLATLRRLNFDQQATSLHDLWFEAYPTHEMTEYEPDIEPVVDWVLTGPYPQLGGEGLQSLMTFTREMQESAENSAARLVIGAEPYATDPRVLFAAARQAYERQPAEYLSKRHADQVVQKVRDGRMAGVRAEDREATRIDRSERDDRATMRLADVLGRAGERRAMATQGGQDVQAQQPQE